MSESWRVRGWRTGGCEGGELESEGAESWRVSGCGEREC